MNTVHDNVKNWRFLDMIKELFYEIFEARKGKNRVLLTKNLVPKKTVYGEGLYRGNGVEYREWDPFKSKIAAAIKKNVNQVGLKKGEKVLYLGAASGTTVSHVSDIVGKEGVVFAVEFSPTVSRELVFLAEQRGNIAPILADANQPQEYKEIVPQVDWLYQDIAQKNQAEIFLKNVELFLKPGSYCLIAIKARSIDVAKPPKQIFKEVRAKLSEKLTLVDHKDLVPFQKDHCFFVYKK